MNIRILILIFLFLSFLTVPTFAGCERLLKICIGSGCSISKQRYNKCVAEQKIREREKSRKAAKANKANHNQKYQRAPQSGMALLKNKKPGFKYEVIYANANITHKYKYHSRESSESRLKDSVYRVLADICWEKREGYIEEETISYTTFEEGHTLGQSMMYRLHAKGANAVCRYIEEKEEYEEKKEDKDTKKNRDKLSDDLWTGKTEDKDTKKNRDKLSDDLWTGKTEDKGDKKNNDNEFWSGKTEDQDTKTSSSDDIWAGNKPKKENKKQADDFWAGKTKDKKSSEDFWGGGKELSDAYDEKKNKKREIEQRKLSSSDFLEIDPKDIDKSRYYANNYKSFIFKISKKQMTRDEGRQFCKQLKYKGRSGLFHMTSAWLFMSPNTSNLGPSKSQKKLLRYVKEYVVNNIKNIKRFWLEMGGDSRIFYAYNLPKDGITYTLSEDKPPYFYTLCTNMDDSIYWHN